MKYMFEIMAACFCFAYLSLINLRFLAAAILIGCGLIALLLYRVNLKHQDKNLAQRFRFHIKALQPLTSDKITEENCQFIASIVGDYDDGLQPDAREYGRESYDDIVDRFEEMTFTQADIDFVNQRVIPDTKRSPNKYKHSYPYLPKSVGKEMKA